MWAPSLSHCKSEKSCQLIRKYCNFLTFTGNQMKKKLTRKRPYFRMESAITTILRDASGKMYHGILLFDRRLVWGLSSVFYSLVFVYLFSICITLWTDTGSDFLTACINIGVEFQILYDFTFCKINVGSIVIGFSFQYDLWFSFAIWFMNIGN